ncbi:MAG TPA: reverse transcriptase-like protein [bacterium]|nr:reverse transcriptase-like protein [bacterium]
MTTGRASATKTIHAYVAAAPPVDGRAGMGVVFVDAQGRILRRIGRTLQGVENRDLAAFRGILYALWNSRRLGSRWIVVHSDTPEVVEQINGSRDVDPAYVGPYLEIRALLHAYRAARVKADSTAWGHEAAAVAAAAREHDSDDTVEDLPLWAGQAPLERSTA